MRALIILTIMCGIGVLSLVVFYVLHKSVDLLLKLCKIIR